MAIVTRHWASLVGGVAAVALVASLALAGPTILHGKQIAGTAVANAADVAAAKAANRIDLLQSTVLVSMQRFYGEPANYPLGARIRVDRVNLVRVGETKFEGVAVMRAADGPQRGVALHVTADDHTYVWTIAPGALAVLFY